MNAPANALLYNQSNLSFLKICQTVGIDWESDPRDFCIIIKAKLHQLLDTEPYSV